MSDQLILFVGLGGLFIVFLVTFVIILVKKYYQQKRQTSASEKYLESIGVTVSSIKNTVRDTVRSEFNFACTERPPCKPGYMVDTNSKGESCCYVDQSKTVPTKEEQLRTIMKDVAEELIITEGTELMITMLPKLYKAIRNPTATAKAVKGAAIAAKAAIQSLIRNGTKTAVRVAATAPLKAAMGPVGWAMLAFDLVSAALDIYDPVGYEEFMSNEVAMNLRNIAEHNFQRIFENEGKSIPALADFDYRNPTGQWALTHAIPNVRARMYDKAINNMPLEMLESFENEDLVAQQVYIADEAQRLLEAYMDTAEYEKEVCDTYKNQPGNRTKVEWINGAGCSMTANECKRFNDYQSKQDPDNRQFALFTNEYRKKIGGSVKKPIMRTYNLPTKACMLSPLGWSKEACTPEKGTWHEDNAMCSYSNRYCTHKGLKTHRMRNGINNCIMYPGQRIAEMFLGKTIYRTLKRTNPAFMNVGSLLEGDIGGMFDIDLESYKALLDGDLTLLKDWGKILSFLSLGPYGMAIQIGFKLGGVDIDLTEYLPYGAIMKHHKEIGKGFEDAYNAIEDSIKEYTNLLEDGVGQMLKNVEKLGKISAKLGKDAAKKVAGMGQEGIDKVSDLLDRLPFREVGEAIDKGIGEIGKIWGAVFGWLPF
jgi:hypothetical protein